MGVFGVTKLKLGDEKFDEEPAIRPVDGPVGTVWVVEDETLARQAFAHPGISKDPAFAPAGWPRWVLGLEPTAAEQPSLTSLDGEGHRELRRAHAPLFTAKVLQASRPRIEEIARELLSAEPDETDLMADFTTRMPLTVICDKLGVPLENVTPLIDSCRRMVSGDIAQLTAALDEFYPLVGQAGAPEFRERMGRFSVAETNYVIGSMVFGGQTTTDGALGFVIAHLLAGQQKQPDAEFVQDVLRRHPPFPYTLWRFTSSEVELGGYTLPPRSPLLIHIEGVNAHGGDITFGAGPHFCVGAQLAQLELEAVVTVLKNDYPHARLTVPFDDLPLIQLGIRGRRLRALPVRLRPARMP
jgi:cytochrome P450